MCTLPNPSCHSVYLTAPVVIHSVPVLQIKLISSTAYVAIQILKNETKASFIT